MLNDTWSSRPCKLVYVVTSPLSFRLLGSQIAHLSGRGFDVELICGNDMPIPEGALGGIPIHVVPMRREISPLQDFVSGFQVTKLLRRIRPDIVNVSTPKAALIGSISAALAGVRRRVYLMRGLRFETATGLKRQILWWAERLVCSLNLRTYCVSKSLRQKALDTKVAAPLNTSVLGFGSSHGVEAADFERAPVSLSRARELRSQLNIPDFAPVVGFVGRFTRDKGIAELIAAFRMLQKRFPEIRLLLLGDFEEGDPVSPELRQQIGSDPRIVRTGFLQHAAPYYHLMDTLVLPTHREGFPNVCLEAQAASVPVVTTAATGAVDSVVPGVTGFLVPIGNSTALAEAVGKLLADRELCTKMGSAGRDRVRRDFQPEVLWHLLEREYEALLHSNPLPQMGWRRIAKLAFDKITAAMVLVLLSPVLLVIAALIAVTMGFPVLFRQERSGRLGRPFALIKFRTMRNATDRDGELLRDGDRLTSIGRLLRSWSLDELPQLWNVLRGEISLVGPRPLFSQYLARYTPEQARRHEVLPGITGWTQVNGRNALTWEQKFALDVWYVDHWSLKLDLVILWRTLASVLKRDGISQPGHVTMPEFMGSVSSETHGS